MTRAAVLAVLTFLAGPALAQDWATVEVCTVDAPEIVDEAFSPPGRAALEEAAAGVPNGTGRFWRIEAPSGAVSHLWGTFHASDRLILDLPQPLEDVIDAARVVAVEVDFIHPSRQSYRDAQYYPSRFLEGGDPFEATGSLGTIAGVPEEIDGWIRERGIELGWTEDMDLVLSPGGIAEMLLSDPCEDFSTGILPIQDDYIQLQGRIAGARILGLEAQTTFLDDLAERPEIAQAITAVYGSYLRPVTSNDERETAFGIYLEGRLGLMTVADSAYINEVLGDSGTQVLTLTDDYLLRERNERFLQTLLPELDQGGVVVAIGAGHLPGETGMIELLRGAGYTLTREALPGEAE